MNYLRSSLHYMWSTTDVLGKGATGSVYRGVHKETGESVAVKTFNHTSHLRPLEVQMREFEVMSKCDHENIVKMLAIEEEVESRKKVIVMELCDAGSLFTILDDPENTYGLEEEEFLRVLKDLSGGMKYLRDNHIIHRDLKPGNIMKYISIDGRSIYKLTDFGAARELDDDQQFMSLYGTEEYLHPDMYERAVLRHPANKSFRATVDLYSTAVTLYHVATGSLPFRPYGGERIEKQCKHYIITNKAPGVISGVQHSEKGLIEWSKELPKTCLLNQGLKELVTKLLAGILECNAEKMWTFDQFFECATDVINRKVFYVFYMNEGKEIRLYMQPDKRLQDLKEQISLQTNVPEQNQLLIINKSLLSEQVYSHAQLLHFPTTSHTEPIIMVDVGNTDVKDLTRLSALSACFPNFPSTVNLAEDASLAKTCCSVAHAVKRIIVKLVRSRNHLMSCPEVLTSLSREHISKLYSGCEDLKKKAEEIHHIINRLEKNYNLVSEFLSLWSDKNHCDNELKQLCLLVSEKKQLKEQIRQKVIPLSNAIGILYEKITSSTLQYEWEQAAAECTNLTGCVEIADTYVRTIRGSWQSFVRDKNSRALSIHDEKFHNLEKIKIQYTCKKLESLLQDRCSKACIQASNVLDEWYSGMQATMVQCNCLTEDLAFTHKRLNDYVLGLREAETKVYELSMQIVSSLKSSAGSESNTIRQMSPSQLPTELPKVLNGASHKKLNGSSEKNLRALLQNLKEEQKFIRETAKENNETIIRLSKVINSLITSDYTQGLESKS